MLLDLLYHVNEIMISSVLIRTDVKNRTFFQTALFVYKITENSACNDTEPNLVIISHH